MAARKPRQLKRPVGVWIRVSTEHQAQSDSPEVHEHRAKGYAAAKDWEVVKVYRLAGVSGKAVRNHPECRRMMEDVKAGKIEALIFSKLARLARSTRDLLEFSDFFREHKADLVSLKENIDTGTHGGRLFYTMIAAMAQWEREEISSRVREAVAVRAKMGKHIGGAAPFGYQWQDGDLVLEPDEAPVRTLMYELFEKLQRVRAVAKELNERGLRNRKGNPFSPTTIRNYLLDPVSKGMRRTNHTEKNPVTGKTEPKPESEWIYIPAPAVVSEEVWTRVTASFERRSEDRKKRPGRRSRHLFTGLLRCACGKKMYVPSRSAQYECKACSNNIATDDIEAIFLEKLRGWLTPETVAAILLQTDQLVQERKALVESLTRQHQEAEADLDRLFDLHAKGEVPTEGFRLRYEPKAERVSSLAQELATVQGELDCFQTALLSEEQALSEAEGLLGGLETLDPDLKRETVQTLVEEIQVGREEVVLRLKYQPFLSLETPTRLQIGGGLEGGDAVSHLPTWRSQVEESVRERGTMSFRRVSRDALTQYQQRTLQNPRRSLSTSRNSRLRKARRWREREGQSAQ